MSACSADGRRARRRLELLDGVVTCEPPFTRAAFHAAEELEDRLQRAFTKFTQSVDAGYRDAADLQGENVLDLRARCPVGLSSNAACSSAWRKRAAEDACGYPPTA